MIRAQIVQFGFLGLIALLITACSLSSASGDGAFVEYKRTGGFAGFDDTLVIQADGAATLTRHGKTTSFTLDKAELRALSDAFEAADFTRLKRKYPPPDRGADYITYTITYKGYTVQVTDTNIPSQLEPVLEQLNAVVSDRGAS